MKKLLLLMLVAMFSMKHTYSQNVRYKVKKDDPSDFKNFMIHLDPCYMDLYSTNLSMGWALRADWMPFKFFDASFQIRKPYVGATDFNYNTLFEEKTDTSMLYPVKDFAIMKYMELTGELHFVDKIKNTSHRVVLSQSTSTSGNVRTTRSTFINVPGTVRKIKSLRGGVIWSSTAIEYDGMGSSDKVGDFKFVGKEDNATEVTADGGTMMRSMIMYAGLSAQTITNFKVLTDKYGVKYNTGWNNIYLDFMFAPVLNFAPVGKGGQEYDVENSNMKRTGWKFGYVVRNHKGPAMSMAMTFGQRPGYVGNGGFIGARSFFDFNFGLSLPYRVSLKPKKK